MNLWLLGIGLALTVVVAVGLHRLFTTSGAWADLFEDWKR